MRYIKEMWKVELLTEERFEGAEIVYNFFLCTHFETLLTFPYLYFLKFIAPIYRIKNNLAGIAQ